MIIFNQQHCSRPQNGYTYIGLLLAIAIIGVGLSIVSEIWAGTAHRQKLAQLDWIGEQYIDAIRSYYYNNLGGGHFYPNSTDDLLEDKRHPAVKRHIRALYLNPFTNLHDWSEIKNAEGGIIGVEYKLDCTGNTMRRRFIFTPPLEH